MVSGGSFLSPHLPKPMVPRVTEVLAEWHGPAAALDPGGSMASIGLETRMIIRPEDIFRALWGP